MTATDAKLADNTLVAASHLTQSAAVKTSLLECSSILIIYLHQILKFVTLPLCLRRGNMRHQILNQQQAS